MWDMQVARAAFFFLLIALLPGWAWAQMYLWEDEQGTVHYTNELQSVPEPYRSRARFVPASPMAPPAVAPAQGITRIPFTPGSPILVNARINGGGPVTLILDTGADRTLLTPMALWRLGISTDNAPPAEIKGATGAARAALGQGLSGGGGGDGAGGAGAGALGRGGGGPCGAAPDHRSRRRPEAGGGPPGAGFSGAVHSHHRRQGTGCHPRSQVAKGGPRS